MSWPALDRSNTFDKSSVRCWNDGSSSKILSGLPAAGVGALLTLMLFKMDLSVIAIIGVIMLGWLAGS